MIYVSEQPGQTPKTLVDAFVEAQHEDLSGILADALDIDAVFTKRTCPVLGDVIDIYSRDLDSGELEHWETVPDDDGHWRKEWLLEVISGVTVRLLAYPSIEAPEMTLKEALVRSLFFREICQWYNEGAVLRKWGLTLEEVEPRSWQIVDATPTSQRSWPTPAT